MWWRALPVVIAITCTFQTEIKAEFDDIMCVLLLSGLKKGDMDDVLLKKLEQHNINVDDMNNEKNIEKCVLKANLEKALIHLSTPAVEQAINTQYELQATPEHFNITTINTIANEFKPNSGNTIKNIFDLKYGQNGFKYENEKVSMLYSIDNAMNLMKYINKVKPEDEKISTKVTRSNIVEVPTNLSKTILFHESPKELEDIKKIIDDYISAKQKSTTSKPTTEINIDTISQQVLKIVENNNNNYKELMSHISAVNGKIEAEYPQRQNPKENNDNSIGYINALLRQTYLNMQIPPNTDPKQYYKNNLGTTRINMPQESSTTKIDLKPIQGDIIKEITEQVKKSVLEDFQKQMLSTLETTTENSKTEDTTVIATTTSTTLSTTKKLDFPDKDNATDVIENFKMLLKQLRNERQIENKAEIQSTTTISHLAQDRIKDTANILQNFMEILNQLKSAKDSTENVPIKYKSTEKVTTNQFHDPINVVYPPAPIDNLAHNIGTNAPTLIPVNAPQPFLQINNSVAKKTNTYQNNPQQRIAIKAPIEKQVSERQINYYMNPANTFGNSMDMMPLMPPIIQTDALEVPPIGIPVPKTVRIMNQNIVITTQHPMDRYNEEQRNRHTKKPTMFQNYAMRNDDRITAGLVRPEAENYPKYGIERNYDFEQPYAQRGASPQNNDAEKQQNINIRPPLDFQQFYKEYMRQINNAHNRNGPQYPALAQNGRYHEQLETPQEWQINRDKKTRPADLWKRDFAENNQKSIEKPNEWQKYFREHEKRENNQLWKRDYEVNNENNNVRPINEWQKHFRQIKSDNSLGPRDYHNRDETNIITPEESQKHDKDYKNRSEQPNTWQRDYTNHKQKRPDEWKNHFMDHQKKLERPNFWQKDDNNENKHKKPVEWHKYFKGHQNVSDNVSSQTNHGNYDKKNKTANVLKSHGKHHVKSTVTDNPLKVASRQQLSMQDLKKARYDDAHFQKFLKTQQKVNDMLENILATKEPEIRSVEAPDTISMYIS